MLDRARHVDLRVVSVIGGTRILDRVGAHDIARAPMPIHVVDAVLRVVFFDEDRRGRPHLAVADVVDHAAHCKVIVGLLRIRRRRAARVVVHDPQDAQCGHRACAQVLVEVLQPQIDAELIGNAEIELGEVLDQVFRYGRNG